MKLTNGASRGTASLDLFLVEDSLDDITLVKRLLKDVTSAFYHITINMAFCHTIKEAEFVLQSNGYNLILLDLSLPDSIELSGLKALVEKLPHIPIVIYSGNYNPEIAEQAIFLGAQDYILKGTMTADELVRTLYHAKLRHQSVMKLRTLIEA